MAERRRGREEDSGRRAVVLRLCLRLRLRLRFRCEGIGGVLVYFFSGGGAGPPGGDTRALIGGGKLQFWQFHTTTVFAHRSLNVLSFPQAAT